MKKKLLSCLLCISPFFLVYMSASYAEPKCPQTELNGLPSPMSVLPCVSAGSLGVGSTYFQVPSTNFALKFTALPTNTAATYFEITWNTNCGPTGATPHFIAPIQLKPGEVSQTYTFNDPSICTYDLIQQVYPDKPSYWSVGAVGVIQATDTSNMKAVREFVISRE
jgi:hypothetical protein